nr:probable receptor-like protein kinase At5g24010 [Coffea arabica]
MTECFKRVWSTFFTATPPAQKSDVLLAPPSSYYSSPPSSPPPPPPPSTQSIITSSAAAPTSPPSSTSTTAASRATPPPQPPDSLPPLQPDYSTHQLRPASSNSSPLYRTARAFSSPCKYSFPIQDHRGGTHHLVRLHFSPFFNSTSFDFSAVQFHVLANGFLLLRDFSIQNSPKDGIVIKEYIIRVDSDKLDITFVPKKRSNFAFVNAIEVISAPHDLVADVAQFVNSEKNERINGLLNKGFETVYRVNVGGPKWPDSVSDGGATREVGPDNVYNSARVIKSSNNVIPKSNIAWVFPGIEGYKYLVRMHFCDIASIGPYMLYFNVYVNGNLAYEDLDLSAMTNMLLASPFYADFVVEGLNSESLNVSVGPSNMSLTNAVDAILNGVEVFKISNSLGSFDGELCVESVMKSWRRGNAVVIVPLLAAVFLLLTASVVVQRRRSGGRDTVGWLKVTCGMSLKLI